MKVKLWGTRGSIPVPGKDTVEYGGNTLCVEMRFGEKERLIVIDGGTGIRPLANHILNKDLPKGPIRGDLFFSHTHWDHIMGFPFFVPIYIPGTQLKIYGPVTFEDESLDKVIGGQLQYRYFPVKHSELAARLEYVDLKEGELDLGDGIQVRTKYLNHPVSCLGYRFTHAGKTVCTLFDHEPFRNIFPTDPGHPDYDELMAEEGELVAREENEKIIDFFRGADVVLYDCQYTEEEYLSSKLGWGHSCYEHAISSAREGDVKRLLMLHHEPMRTDAQLDKLEAYCKSLQDEDSGMEIGMAREGQEIIL